MEEKLQLLDELMMLASQHRLTELSIRFGQLSVSLKKGGALPAETGMLPGSRVPVITAPAGDAAPVTGAAMPRRKAGESGGGLVSSGKLAKVVSPLAGVFYRAPSPTTRSFTEIGQPVSPGQVLCIIEAMKIMNEITCEVPGVILQILVENGAVVEEGETLFLIDTGRTS